MLRSISINKKIVTQVIFGFFVISAVLFCGNVIHHFSMGSSGNMSLMGVGTDTTIMECCTTSVQLPPATILRSASEIQFLNILNNISIWYFLSSLLVTGLLLGLRNFYYSRSHCLLQWPRHHLAEALAQGIINPRLYQLV